MFSAISSFAMIEEVASISKAIITYKRQIGFKNLIHMHILQYDVPLYINVKGIAIWHLDLNSLAWLGSLPWPLLLYRNKNLKTLILILALEWACVKNRKRVPKYSQLTLDRSRFLLIMPLAVQLQPALHYIMGLYYFWSFKMRWPAWNSSGNSLEYEGLSLKKCWTASWHHSTLLDT